MSFQIFLEEIEKGLPSHAYLLYASEEFLHREAIEAIKGIIPVEERDFNLHIFDVSLSGREELGQILDVANTFPFFRRRRFLILENLQGISELGLKILGSYTLNPSPDSVLIMLYKGTLKKELTESLKKTKFIALDMKETEIPYWLKQRARTSGVEISYEVAYYLVELLGPDIGILSAEIEKISLIGKEQIGVEDIADIVAGGGNYNLFDLVDALCEKDANRVFKIYRTLRETVEDYNLIGVLNWQYGRLVDKTNEYLFSVFELLSNADIDIKSSGRAFPIEYLLVKLLRL